MVLKMCQSYSGPLTVAIVPQIDQVEFVGVACTKPSRTRRHYLRLLGGQSSTA